MQGEECLEFYYLFFKKFKNYYEKGGFFLKKYFTIFWDAIKKVWDDFKNNLRGFQNILGSYLEKF